MPLHQRDGVVDNGKEKCVLHSSQRIIKTPVRSHRDFRDRRITDLRPDFVECPHGLLHVRPLTGESSIAVKWKFGELGANSSSTRVI
ncbi:hypothetical protein AVEN_139845-1 [Araneus ventricosus]|uniref:Uncharacterized protein n=1 Tax=Araneus ventricosus TaxID=182803 RepID=A0A4Y2G0X6_ARAVE|nr:hypothetical protein AVEN_139845-1 [Araneus ventricosus]